MGPGLAGVPSLTITWSLSTAGAVVLSSTRSTKPVEVSGVSTTSPVTGSTAYRMIRTRSLAAAGVALGSSTYAWVVTSHTNVFPRSGAGTTLALIAPENTAALRRSARRRAAAFTSSVLDVRGGVIGAARSSAPMRLGAATGEPVVVSLTLLKLWIVGDSSTPDTVCRSLLKPAGLDRWACGPVISLHAAMATAAATARPHRV